MKHFLPILLLCILVLSENIGQSDSIAKIITLNNPSFEGVPMQSSPPALWTSLDFEGESPPDIHPGGFWGVTRKPFHGKTYLGMVARENSTGEKVSQKLSTPLLKDTCYSFSIYLCTSEIYESGMNIRVHGPFQIRGSDSTFNFIDPLILLIWGSDKSNKNAEILSSSLPISHYDWKKYTFQFKPTSTHEYLVLEAAYPDINKPVNGNLLLDNASQIIPIICK